MPAHNVAPLIARTADAIISQLGDDDRLIVVENGSTDATWDILCRLYGEENRVVLERQATPDAAQARTKGIALSKAEYVAFCDADDLWCSTKLAFIREVLQRTGAQMLLHPLLSIVNGLPVVLGAKFIENKLPRSDALLTDLLFGNFISTSGFVVQRSGFSVPAFAQGLKQTQDYEAWCQLALRHPHPLFAYIDEPLAFYRFGGGLSQAAETRIVNVSGIVRRYARHLPPRLRLETRLWNVARVLWYSLKDGPNPRLLWRALFGSPHSSIRDGLES
jgi:glycosyltransferase involved in cell wall biosynthesis